jgi:hypothetical protein
MLCTLAGFSNLCSASAAPGDWERLPDGRVIIQVKDVRLALPSAGADVELIQFNERGLRRRMTLKNVIAAPDEARKMFSEAERVSVHIPNVADRNDLFLNHFDRSDFRSFAADIVVGDGAQSNCKDWERKFLGLQATLTKGGVRAQADGWAEVKEGSHPIDLLYIRIGEREVQPRSTRGLSCDITGMCHVSTCVGHKVGASYQFARRVFDRPEWELINGRAMDTINFVLIDSTK